MESKPQVQKLKEEWPKERMFEDLKVSFYKISNEKLGEIYEAFMRNAAKATKVNLDKSLFKNEEEFKIAQSNQDLVSLLDAVGDDKMKGARTLFFKNMFIEGIGIINDKLEDILEINLGYSLQLFFLALEVYLGKHLGLSGESKNLS